MMLSRVDVFFRFCMPHQTPDLTQRVNVKNAPSSGEKPPFSINSRSHNCLSVSTIAGKVSASAESSSCRGASRARRSLRTPPWGLFAIVVEVCKGGKQGGESEDRGAVFIYIRLRPPRSYWDCGCRYEYAVEWRETVVVEAAKL